MNAAHFGLCTMSAHVMSPLELLNRLLRLSKLPVQTACSNNMQNKSQEFGENSDGSS